MAKPVQDKYIGARVDANTKSEILQYADDSSMDVGDLIRKAVEEYMTNHPVQEV